uniref:NADH-ubiquinone oxidoreductase chain 4 n=1 Tax=Rasbora borapetensis TaxID=496993 RepID=X5IXJ7_9TELE|nr:NADH dehydrogenase subunit 4 [Rasbora borapetensis]
MYYSQQLYYFPQFDLPLQNFYEQLLQYTAPYLPYLVWHGYNEHQKQGGLPLMHMYLQTHYQPHSYHYHVDYFPYYFYQVKIMLTQNLLTVNVYTSHCYHLSKLSYLYHSAPQKSLYFMLYLKPHYFQLYLLLPRCGNQAERLNAGIYFLFYTLAGSLPLLIALLILQQTTGTLSMLILQYTQPLALDSCGHKICWAGCLIAFLVKMPLYGVHLCLPKAHVEAPVAGSMVLAAILLKLGGYGMMRMMIVLDAFNKELAYPFIILALWGIIMTGSICLRQTDLKSLIAYSSVSHMGLVAGGILIQTPCGFSGAIALMIAHGLTSSMLFCLANTTYERVHSRTMILIRGMQMIFPLTATCCFIANLANLALPPLPNLVGELTIITTMFNCSPCTIALTGMGMLITASYSLYMFLMTQRGQMPNHIMNLSPYHTREHLLMALHLIPIILLVAKPELLLGCCY